VTALAYFAAKPWHLALVRFVSAIGMGGQWSLGVALVMECWPEKWRPMLAGAMGAAANVGFLLVSVMAILHAVTVQEWRWMMLVAAVPALLVVFIVACVGESKKWKAATLKAPDVNPVREIFSPRLRKRTLLAICFASIALIGTWGSVTWLPPWADKLVGGKLPMAKAYTQVLQALGSIVGCLVAPLVGARFGRRPAFFALCASSFGVCYALFHSITAFGPGFLAFAFFANVTTASFYGWFPLYLPELFPTRVRATGQGVSYNTGRLLAAVGALAQGALMAEFGGSYARAGSVITLVYLLGLVLIWFAPETKGHPLPD
jgi:MFS family permease